MRVELIIFSLGAVVPKLIGDEQTADEPEDAYLLDRVEQATQKVGYHKRYITN